MNTFFSTFESLWKNAVRSPNGFALPFLPATASLVLLACGGSAAKPTTTSHETEPPAVSASGESKDASAPVAWSSSLSKAEKAAFMKQTVLPRMRAVFQQADPSRYAEFGCVTCHGPNFEDPDDFLPALTLKSGALSAFAEKPAVAKFMGEKVVPEMAALLGQTPYDPKTHQGFGCAGCHSIASK